MTSDLQGDCTSFGERLKARRKLLDLSQEALGVSIGLDESCSRTRISRYETGVHEPSLATAQMLADALKVPLAYLYCKRNSLADLILASDQLSDQQIEALIQNLQKELGKPKT